MEYCMRLNTEKTPVIITHRGLGFYVNKIGKYRSKQLIKYEVVYLLAV